jgi:predicted nucleic acid-binding protein
MTMIYLRKIHELVAPAVIDEAAGALTKAERQKDSAVGQAAPLDAKVMNSPPVLITHASLIAKASDISSRTRSGYYDCLYVARAEREGCELVSAGRKSINNLAPHFPFR